jgi:hypothetical protein
MVVDMAYRRSDTSKTSIYDDERNARALAEVPPNA